MTNDPTDDVLLEQSVRLLNEAEAVRRRYSRTPISQMKHLQEMHACLDALEAATADLLALWQGRIVCTRTPAEPRPLPPPSHGKAIFLA